MKLQVVNLSKFYEWTINLAHMCALTQTYDAVDSLSNFCNYVQQFSNLHG
jgi:uncharacterized protein YfkK (UPF0435 family)